MDQIYLQAEKTVQTHGTRDPYEPLECMNVITRFSCEFAEDGLKGFSAIFNRAKYVVINSDLDEWDRKVVAGHEAAHLILHEEEILSGRSKALRDFDLWSTNGRLEYEANQFLADFLVSDERVLSAADCYDDYCAIASELYLPQPLLAFKLHSMMCRELPVRSPVDLKSNFLARAGTW